jgi:hypothetical protein
MEIEIKKKKIDEPVVPSPFQQPNNAAFAPVHILGDRV